MLSGRNRSIFIFTFMKSCGLLRVSNKMLQIKYCRMIIRKIVNFRKRDSGITEIITKLILVSCYGMRQ